MEEFKTKYNFLLSNDQTVRFKDRFVNLIECVEIFRIILFQKRPYKNSDHVKDCMIKDLVLELNSLCSHIEHLFNDVFGFKKLELSDPDISKILEIRFNSLRNIFIHILEIHRFEIEILFDKDFFNYLFGQNVSLAKKNKSENSFYI